jgi:hypothetical protein
MIVNIFLLVNSYEACFWTSGITLDILADWFGIAMASGIANELYVRGD